MTKCKIGNTQINVFTISNQKPEYRNQKNICLVTGYWLLVTIFVLICAFSFASDEKGGSMQTAQIIQLPSPKLKSNVSLEEAIYKRRSRRSFSQKELTLEEISQLLWSAQGVTDERRGFRAAPSPGALYPLEIYAVKKGGFFHYIPEGHRLKLVSSDDLRARLAQAAWGQDFIKEAALDIVICAVYSRVTSKYGQRGIRYTDIEVGHVGQNIQLEAVSLGLGSCVVGAFDTKEVTGLLNLPRDEEPVYIIPVGYSKLGRHKSAALDYRD